MTQEELIKKVADLSGEKKPVVENVIKATLDSIKWAVTDGETIIFRGFGTFIPLVQKSRKARNIRTGEEITLPESIKPTFKASKDFKDACNK